MNQKTLTFKDFWAQVKALPQGKHIKQKDARAWLRAAKEDPHHDPAWHLRRLTGFGGSDIGVIVSTELGEFDPFTSVQDIVAAKLMKVPPNRTTSDMERGQDVEPLTRRLTRNTFKARPREDIRRAFQSLRGKGTPPWMHGYPDDILEVGENAHIDVVDYKAPKDTHQRLLIAYVAQVHQYKYLMLKHHQKIEAGLKRKADIANAGMRVVYLDYPNWRPIDFPVEYDEAVMHAILEGGDKYWACVCEGVIPKVNYSGKTALEYSEIERARILRLERQYAEAKVFSDAAKQRESSLREQLEEAITQGGSAYLSDHRSPTEVVTAYGNLRTKDDEIEESAELHDINLDELRKPTKKLDADALFDYLWSLYERHPRIFKEPPKSEHFLERKLDAQAVREVFMRYGLKPPLKESITMKVTPRSKGLDKEQIEALREQASTTVNTLFEHEDAIDEAGDAAADVAPEPIGDVPAHF